MEHTYKPEISANLVQWLNNKTASSNHRVVLLDGFIYMLQKLKRQRTVRLTTSGQFHNRFWKSLDQTLDYNLYRKKTKKIISVPLYYFYYRVSIEEKYINIEGCSATLTEKGMEFLRLSQEQQLNILLNKIW